MKKGKRRWWLIALIAVIVVAAAVTAGLLLLNRNKSATVHYLTSTAATGTIAETVQADFTLAGASGTSGSTVSSGANGVVTDLAFAAGKAPTTLAHLVSLSGTPLYAFVSPSPLYETLSTSLSSGAQVTNVEVLQRALTSAGYYSGSIDGVFGTTTQTALEDWQDAQGLSQTGEVTTAQFVWVPKRAVIESWNVGLGSSVRNGSALATIEFPRDLIAEAPVAQANVSSLKVGQKAALTLDGVTSDPFTATITSIANQPASSSSSSGTSSTVDYTVDLAPHSLPSLAKSGMTGSLTVTIASRSNVLLVPTSAVSGSSSASFVRVMLNGTPTYRQVTMGMATSTLTQITSGLTAGEVVVTGTYTNSATTNSGTSTTGGLGGLGGLGGGSFRTSGGGGGFPAGGGGFPAGGSTGGGQ
jgi:peptidoglycan hydrolase-like protein with peptidoglycan-binding domain